MKIEAQGNPELAQLAALAAHVNVAMLTTFNADGALVSRPMTPQAMDAGGALWFFIERNSLKTEHLRVVNLSLTDAHQAIYVSISGVGEIHDDAQRIKELWTPFALPWFPDGPDSGKISLLKVLPRTAEYWGEPQSRMVRFFGRVASVITGRPFGRQLGTRR